MPSAPGRGQDKGHSLYRISWEEVLFRAEISRCRIGGTLSPELGELRDWWLSSPPFPASGPWIRVGSPSQPQLALAEVLSLRRLERGVVTVDSSSCGLFTEVEAGKKV